MQKKLIQRESISYEAEDAKQLLEYAQSAYDSVSKLLQWNKFSFPKHNSLQAFKIQNH